MPGKKRTVKIEQNKQNMEEGKASSTWLLLGAALIFLGCVFAVALFSADPEDTLNLLYKAEAVLLGKMSFVLPLALLSIGFKLVLKKQVGYFNKKVWGTVLMLFSLLGLCHLYFAAPGESAIEAYQTGGGIFGYLFVKLVGGIVGETASGIVFAVLFIISLLVVMPLGILAAILLGLKDKILGSSASDEDEENYPKRENTSKRKVSQPVYQETKISSRADSEGLNPHDIYNSSEFGSFNEGIKKESAYKKVINFAKSETYGSKKEEKTNEPLQISDWEEPAAKNPRAQWTEKKNISQGRIIHWEDLARQQQLKEEGRKENTASSWEETNNVNTSSYREADNRVNTAPYREEAGKVDTTPDEEYAIGASSGSSVITNFYREDENKAETAVPINQDVQDETAQTEMGDSIQAEVNEVEPDESNQPEGDAPLNITIEDSADKIEGEALTEAEALARDKAQKEAQTATRPQSKYIKPPVSLLNPPVRADRESWEQGVKEQCAVLEKTLADFKVRARVINVTRGPSVTRFELEPAPGVKVASIVNLADDIALRLAASGVRIEAPIPGKSAVGIEAPNLKNDMVAFREVVDTDVVKKDPSPLAIGLGKNISGDIISANLGKMPHTLIAGSTGSGKSVCVNTIIAGLLYKSSPEEVKLILVDPKVVELSNYNGIPHLLTPVVTDPKKAASALRWGVNEMERRYQLFADNHVREITAYNKKEDVEKLPYIVIIIDELADLMMVAKVDVEEAILRLAQKARACGIHLILATQRPSVDVITGIVKANIPSRIAFAVSSQMDSRTILDGAGAEKLLGKGDMLFKPVGVNTPMRVQGAFVTDEELAKIVDFVKKQGIATEYNEEVTKVELSSEKDKASAQEQKAEADNSGPEEDPLFQDVLRLVLDTGQVSSSMLQRRFRIGYTRAARLVDTLEELGIVGQSVGAKPREVIMSRQEVENRFLNS